MIIYSYSSFTSCNAFFNRTSREIVETNSISAPANEIVAGTIYKFSTFVSCIVSKTLTSSIKTS